MEYENDGVVNETIISDDIIQIGLDTFIPCTTVSFTVTGINDDGYISCPAVGSYDVGGY